MKKILFVLAFISMISLVAATSFEFEKDERVNFRFRCLDENNEYCTSTTILTISIEDPEGLNAFDNSTMTPNPTFYNHTLPTNKIGDYSVIIVAPGDANATTEFSYEVSPIGRNLDVLPVQLIILFGGFIIIVIGKLREDLRLFTLLGSMLTIIMGLLTLYPGYEGIDYSTLLGLGLGTVSLGIGFYFLIESSFSREVQVDTYQQNEDGRFHNN